MKISYVIHTFTCTCTMYIHCVYTYIHIPFAMLRQQLSLSTLTGLQLKTKDKQLKAFTYALAPLTEGINPVKKKPLVTDDDVQADHVRAHKLESTEKLAGVVAHYRECERTKAVVVVNTADSLELDPAYLEGLKPDKFPVLIVSQRDGREMMDILEHEDEVVLCDIEVESAVDAPVHQQHQTQAVTEQPRAGGKGGASQESKATGMHTFVRVYYTFLKEG